MCVSLWGAVPDDLDFEFNPVRDTSEEERANLIQQSADAILNVYNAGLISQQTALKELRQSGVAYSMWSNITDEDIENADSETEQDEMGLAGMQGMGGVQSERGSRNGSGDDADEMEPEPNDEGRPAPRREE